MTMKRDQLDDYSYPWCPNDDIATLPYGLNLTWDEDGTCHASPNGYQEEYPPPLLPQHYPVTCDMLKDFPGLAGYNAVTIYKDLVEHNPLWISEESFDWYLLRRAPFATHSILRVFHEELSNYLSDDAKNNYLSDDTESIIECLRWDAIDDLSFVLEIKDAFTFAELKDLNPDLASLVLGIVMTFPDEGSAEELSAAVVDAYTMATGIPIGDYDLFTGIVENTKANLKNFI